MRCYSGATGFASVSLRDVDTRFSTGRASGTLNETDNFVFFKPWSLFAPRMCANPRQTLVRGANGHTRGETHFLEVCAFSSGCFTTLLANPRTSRIRIVV